jgi:hypothetical protein
MPEKICIIDGAWMPSVTAAWHSRGADIERKRGSSAH